MPFAVHHRRLALMRRAARLRPLGALFLGLTAFAERHDLGWVDGVAVDLHFDDFAALVDQIVDAASRFVLGIVEAILAGDSFAPLAEYPAVNFSLFYRTA